MAKSNDEEDKYITLDVAKRLLGVGSHTMTTLLATGELPFIENPFNRRQKLIRLSDLHRIRELGVPADSTIHHTVTTWIIYALIDPRDDTIRYVGRTIETKRRLQQHLQEVSINKRKEKWLRELRKLGMTRRMEILEALECIAAEAEKRETDWIRYLLSIGTPLLNIRGV
jgi:predicted GIY-YIG superfamily endonuclease